MELRSGQRHVTLFMVFVLLGFLLVTAFTAQQTQGGRSGRRKTDLVQFINKRRSEQKRLAASLSATRKEIAGIDLRRAKSEGVLAGHSRELASLRERAGLSPVRGPGLALTIGDAQRVPPDIGRGANLYLVNDSDLQILVNALWRGGAEAISINGERLVVSSGIRSAGSTIMINSSPLGGPYRIHAIGNPGALNKALADDSDASLLLGGDAAQFGLMLEVKPMKVLKLPGYAGGVKISDSGAD